MENRFTIIKNLIIIINLTIFFFLIFIGRNQYIYNINYFKSILFMVLTSVFIYIYGILLNKEKIYQTNILIYIFLFIILLISITFFIGRSEINFYSWWYAGQFKPFHTIISQFKYGSNLSILKNIFGNSIMLIPLSLMLMIKDIKYKNILRQSIIIILATIIIELLQTFTHTGSFDIDDIILNYLGVVIFTFLITRFNIIDKIRKLFFTDFKLKKRNKIILFYLGLIAIIINNIIIFII